MSTSTVISSVESIPLPPAAPQNRRPAKGPKASKWSEALESNASESQSLVPDTTLTGEYVENIQSVDRKVEPISRAILSNPGTTMAQLHKMATHELDVLDALNNEGRQIIKTRLIAIWEAMSVRFERGESVNGISGTGGKGMGKYLRSIGINPAKRRIWKFEIRQQEALRLAQENPPMKGKRTTKKEIVINSETEADLIAKAGIKMAQVLAGDNMTSPQPSRTDSICGWSHCLFPRQHSYPKPQYSKTGRSTNFPRLSTSSSTSPTHRKTLAVATCTPFKKAGSRKSLRCCGTNQIECALRRKTSRN
jgi:hypothetical protein